MPPRRRGSPAQSSSPKSSGGASQSSGTQSSGGKKTQDDSISIPFAHHRGPLVRSTGVGSSYLQMPSGIKTVNMAKGKYPMTVLVIKDYDENHAECLLRMKNLTHENVLGVYYWENDANGSYIRAHVEPYTDFISNIMDDPVYFVEQTANSVPSPAFQEIVSATINALDYIRESGYYHGNFSWNTTLYHQLRDKRIVKLANFELKGLELLQCQAEDCVSLGASLESASQFVKKNYRNYEQHTCFAIDDLARRLKSVTVHTVETMKSDFQDHEFFWDIKRKKIFFAYDVPRVWNNEAVLENFRQSPSMPIIPWSSSWIPGDKGDELMKHMVIYRDENGLGSYDYYNLKEFLRFISGMYSHENELGLKIPMLNLDSEVRKRYPRLFFDLTKAIRDAMEVHNE